MQRLECGKLFEGCSTVIEGDTTDEVLTQAATHVRDTHDLETIDEATLTAVTGAIETR